MTYAEGKPLVAYIGAGLMGGPMIRRLVGLNYRVKAFDIAPERRAEAAAAGAAVARDAGEAADGADFVLLNLPSASAVEGAIFGEEGAARHMTPPTVLVDFSTVPAAFSRAMAVRLRDSVGCGWVDAPVSGGPVAAGDGTLTIMAGGASDDIARIRPLMADIGRQFTHVGEIGSGSVAKTIAQLVVGSTYAVLAEAARLAELAGMDAGLLPDCVRYGHADGELMRQLYPRIAAHDFAPRAYARQLLKDLEMVQDLARDSGAPTPMSAQASQLFRLFVAAGHGGIDGGGIYRLYEGAPPPATSIGDVA